MPCLFGCLALASPRVALFLLWLFGGSYLTRAFDSHWGFVVIGFFCLPLTTLAFAYAENTLSHGGPLTPLGWLVVGLAVAADLGLLGSGGRSAQRYRQRGD